MSHQNHQRGIGKLNAVGDASLTLNNTRQDLLVLAENLRQEKLYVEHEKNQVNLVELVQHKE